ncbi:MAG: hypothetical protein VYC03_05810 [Pseudomonadota bacterium]|nr:hypothetical protein [Pseudomonadota bacterium]
MRDFLVILVRLSPVLFITFAAIVYVLKIEAGVAYPFRNLLTKLSVVGLAIATMVKGDGSWTGSGWCWLLGTIGFAIPAIGLSLYLHYGYDVDLNGMYSESVYPEQVFRYLPIYTGVAGAIGFAIGWIAGRNV